MGRRAKNKQGDPLPLDADPDLNGSLMASKLTSKPGLRAKPPTSNSNTKLGKRKLEQEDGGGRAAKKPKGARLVAKSKPRAEAARTKEPLEAKGKPVKPNRKGVDLEEDEALDDGGSVGWEDVDDVGVQAEARCVCLLEDVVFTQSTGYR